CGANLGRGEDEVRLPADIDKEVAEATRLAPALGRQRALRIVARPGHRVARVRVPQQVQLQGFDRGQGHGGHGELLGRGWRWAGGGGGSPYLRRGGGASRGGPPRSAPSARPRHARVLVTRGRKVWMRIASSLSARS